ncbi:hypothetical protein KVR01_008214 [Diaporthe batatas]|uniref:uncharacterized protein n=1 Tax=Diaporthe batatas TaxID=748121 RepID=UPI001D054CEE|nr:uncharacterized protein KVR01_008214 [Diaporthe batatas]KAG8162449.1 hypothetical protein KVR01_008214 [Diaporthe batatas]
MAAAKRKDRDEGGSPPSSEEGKKLKMEDEDPSPPTLQSMPGKMEGPDDTFIVGLFSPLFYDILSFSINFFQGAPYVLPRKNEQKEFVQTLAGSDAKLYLASRHTGAKEKIVQAMIWNKLVESLLSVPLKAFIQFPEATMKMFITDAPGFYMWRTMTAQLMQKSYKGPLSWGKDGPRRKDFVDETTDLLSNLSVVNNQEALRERLEDIAQKAYDLATAMARSGAYWVCTMKDPDVAKLHGFQIKTSRMEDMELWDDEEATKKVDLVVAPMLLKYGNSSGQNFDKCQVVEKAKVVMKPKKDSH